MTNISSELEALRNADSFTSLKDAIVDTLNAINNDSSRSEVINDIHAVLLDLSSKVDGMSTDDTLIREDVDKLKNIIVDINVLLSNKADIRNVDDLKAAIEDQNATFANKLSLKADQASLNEISNTISEKADKNGLDQILSQKADKVSLNEIKNSLAEKANSSTVEAELSKKADNVTVNNISKKLSEKANASDINAALMKKADNDTVNTISKTLSEKANASDINAALMKKADSDTVNSISKSLEERASKFADALSKKADSVAINSINKALSEKADNTKVSAALSQKADSVIVNKISRTLMDKVSTSEMNSALSRKVDTSVINRISKTLDEKTSEISEALDQKADVKDIDTLSRKLDDKADKREMLEVMLSGSNAPMLRSVNRAMPLMMNAGAPMVYNLTRDGEIDGEGEGDNTGDNTGSGSDPVVDPITDYGFYGNTMAPTMNYVNTLAGRMMASINNKVDRDLFDEIVGNGFNTWTITDYIIRLREDWHTVINTMITKDNADEVINGGLDKLSSIVAINEEPTESTKLSIEVTDETVELLEKKDFDETIGEYNEMFTFEWRGPFEPGTIDEHGWKCDDEDNLIVRTTDLLGARDFKLNLNSKYRMKIASYDHYKLIIDVSRDWLEGEINYYAHQHQGAEYIRLLVKSYNDEEISDMTEVINACTITMFGTDWTGQNANKPVDISVVDKVSARVTTLETAQVRNESRLNALETNFEAADKDIFDIKDTLVTMKHNMDGKVAAISYGDDGMVYYWGDAEMTIMLGSIGPLVAGSGSWNGQGGGGGGSQQTNNAIMSFKNVSGWATKTISASDTCLIDVNFTSTDDDIPTGAGTLKIYVNGVLKSTRGLNQGDSTVDVSSYLTTGSNLVNLTATDIYDNTRFVKVTVVVAQLTMRSSFDTSIPFSGSILFTCVPTGDVNKTVYYILDGEVLDAVEVATSGRQISYTIPAQEHGSHSLRVYAEAVIDGTEIRSNEIYFEFTCVDGSSDRPVITSSFNTTSVPQYSVVPVTYRVYTSRTDRLEVKLYINDALVSTQFVDRTEQSYSVRADEPGDVNFRIETEGASKTITFNVVASDVQVRAETDSLALYLTANGRSNNESPEVRDTWEYGDISATFTGFNHKIDGWLTDSNGVDILRLSGDDRVYIPYEIFGNDFISTGKTIEIEFSTRDVINYDTPVITCVASAANDLPKLKITPQNALFRGAQTELGTLYKDNEHVRLSIVVEKQSEHRLILFYINGIMSRAIQYASGERFSQLQPVGITIGSNDCVTDIYCIRVYDNSLTRRQVLNNTIADISIGVKKLEAYSRNNVYNASDEITINSINQNVPYFILNAIELPQYKGDKKTITGTYTDPKKPAKSFTFEGCQINVQGTSSSVYYRKNYDLQFKGGFLTNSGITEKYALSDGAIPFNRFVLKADVASSESANNTQLTMFYNDTCPYKVPEMEENDKVRWGIEGYPSLVFWNNINTGEIQFMGKYNFNLPKRCAGPLGYSGNMESWEFERNNSANVVFKDVDFETQAWNADEQVWYPAWYDDWEARFPSEEFRDTTQLGTFLRWVKSTWTDSATGEDLEEPVTYRLDSSVTTDKYPEDDSFTVVIEYDDEGKQTKYRQVTFTKDTAAYRLSKFKAEGPDYFELDSAIFYYLFTTAFTMIDSWAKNMFIGFRGSSADNVEGMDRKVVFEPYDMDTALGTNNSGVLMFGYWHEDTDTVSSVVSGSDSGDKDSPVFNAQSSVFWNNIREAFPAEIREMYLGLRAASTNGWSYRALEDRFENHQSKWCEAIFNEDAYVKYLYPLIYAVTKDEETGQNIVTDRYLTMLQGSKTEQRKWWLWNRFRYLDSKYRAGDAETNVISIRLFNQGTFAITPATNLYASVRFGGGTTPLYQRVEANEPAEFTYVYPNGTPQEMETWIYSADLISEISDLSGFYANEADFARATRLKKLKLGDGAIGGGNPNYSNANLTTVDVRNSRLLEEIDCQNCPNLRINVNLENSQRLKKAYFSGTNITGVSFAEGAMLEEIYLPESVTTIVLIKLDKLTTFEIPSYDNVTRIMLDGINPEVIDPVDILGRISPGSQVSIKNLDLSVSSVNEIDEFYDLLDTMQGVTRERGTDGEWMYNFPTKAQVSGTIHIDDITGSEIAEFLERYPSITIDAANASGSRYYKTWDGSSIIKTVPCMNGVPTSGAPEGPSRDSDAQYDYEFIGWSKYTNSDTADANLDEYIKADHSFYAAYSRQLRAYTITWKNSDDTVLEVDEGVLYGTIPTFDGPTPTLDDEVAIGWDKPVVAVTGDASYSAIYTTKYEVKFYNGSTLITTTYVREGSDATYSGARPTNVNDWTFLGWNTDSSATEADDNALINIRANTTLYAIFRPKYTVTFYSGSRLLTTATVEHGDDAVFLGGTPTNADNTLFLGWNINSAAIVGDPNALSNVTSNRNVYAIFNPMYAVRFYNGNNIIQTVRVESGHDATFTEATPTNVDNTRFLGWNANSNALTADENALVGISKDTDLYAIFNPMYTVSFYNGSTLITSIRVEKGHNATYNAETPTDPNGTFVGWNSDGTAAGPDVNALLNVNADRNLYAMYKPKTSVTFYNGAEFIMTIKVDEGGDVVYTGSTPFDGKNGTFLGWNTDPNATVADPSALNNVNDARVVYAIFRPNYRINFYNGSDLLDSQLVPIGTNVTFAGTIPMDPDGAEFLGWNTNQYATTADSNALTNITANKDLYTIFEQKFTVRFYNGSDLLQSKIVVTGHNVAFTGTTPTDPDGAALLGWNTNPNAIVQDDNALTNITENKDLYAIFEQKYRVRFYGVSSILETKMVPTGHNAVYTGETPTDETDSVFKGWNTNPTTTVADNTVLNNITADKDVYAIFNPKFTVKFYNGSTLLDEIRVENGTNAAYTGETPVDANEGIFLGWNTNSTATTANASALTNITANRDVYAIFKPKFTVSFYNGSTLITSVKVEEGANATYSGSTPTNANNERFLGWNTDPDATVSDNQAALNNVTADRDVYAIFMPKYTVRFYNGSTLITSTSVESGSDATYTGSTPTNANNEEFLGWNTDSTAGAADANALKNVTADRDVYAIFKRSVFDEEITDSWDQILASLDNGTYTTKYKLGNYKPLDLGTEGTVNMQIVAIDTDVAANGTGTAPLTFVAKELLNASKRMNPTMQTGTEGTGAIGGWEKSEMRRYLNETIKPLIPANILSHIIAVTKTQPAYDTSETQFTQTTTDDIWIPSRDEVWSNGTYSAVFNSNDARKKYKVGATSASGWWTRTAGISINFICMSNGGSLSSSTASSASYIALSFCLSSETKAKTISDSWDQILSNIDNGTYATKYQVGQMKPIDFGTEGVVNMQIVAFDTDDKADGSGKAPVTFVAKELLNTTKAMNPAKQAGVEGTGAIGGWEKSELRQYLNETIKPLIPANIRSRMVSVTKTQPSYDTSETAVTQTTTDDIWIPSTDEVNANGTYSAIFNSSNNSRIKRKVPTMAVNYWWLRSAGGNASAFSVTNQGGSTQYRSVSEGAGIAPSFCLDSAIPSDAVPFSRLATAMDNGTYATEFSVGDMFVMDMGSEGVNCGQIVAFDTDDKADGSGKAKVTVISKYVLPTAHRMNPSRQEGVEGTGTIGGWEKSEMRQYLNDTIKPLIPANIRSRMVSVTKTQPSYNTSEEAVTQTTTDDIWIPSENEVKDNGTYSTFFTGNNARKKYRLGATSADSWWLRSASSAGGFRYVSNYGSVGGSGANSTNYVASSFCLD